VAARARSGAVRATGETAVASLAMYDLPEVRAATDAWWRGLAVAFRREGIAEVPTRLDRRAGHHDVCLRPDLLFAQTCGYPLTHALAGRVALVATPCYAAEGCADASYCSFIVVAEGSPATAIADLRGTRCAVNAQDSQSGYSALRAAIAPHACDGRFFSDVTVSGSHVASLQLVAAGTVDVAAIDCVTHALVARYRPAALDGTRVLAHTTSMPGLPYVTRGDADDDRIARLRAGIQRAFADPQLEPARAALLLTAAAVLPLAAYDGIIAIENAAIAAGYPIVA
jgi:ABC-type phosphate/phosphonate transport system substrate-binding protein